MASYNRVVLLGNLTKDPELRQTPSGAPVTELRLAVSETYRDRQTNEQKEVTCFVDVVVWNRQAETCKQYLAKGSQVLVEGRLTYDEWKTPQGESRNKLRVRADGVKFLGAPRRAGETPAGAPAGGTASGAASAAAPRPAVQAASPAAGQEPAPSEPADVDDLPF
jgi:single-strand DNA-binding protein